MENSFWILSSKGKDYDSLQQDLQVDCLIIGGGLTGLTTAYLLAKENKKIAILESDKIGYGSSGRNTGKITYSHGLVYNNISKKYGDKASELYYQSNKKGMELIESIIKEYNIDCNFERVANYIFTEDENYVNQIKEEYKTCEKIGIPYKYIKEIENFPIKIKCGLKLENQAQFNTKKYIDALGEIDESLGVSIYENTPVTDIKKEEDNYIVSTEKYKVTANTVIIASSNPFYDGLRFYFSKEKAMRSYLTVSKLIKPIAKGMFISVESPTKTIRTYRDNGEEYLICGGHDHKTGKCNDENGIYEEIVDFAKNTFKIGTIDYKWSTQDYITTDDIAYIGRINDREKNLYIATGYCKWGISTSATAAIVFRDLIVNGESEYEKLYNPSRLSSYINLNYIKENAIVITDYIKSKIKKGDSKFDLEKGEGKVVMIKGQKYGAYRDLDDNVFVVDITCTHLGCELKFNTLEKSWDCPCHGSRFNYDGSILNGPAIKPLKMYGKGKNDIDIDLI